MGPLKNTHSLGFGLDHVVPTGGAGGSSFLLWSVGNYLLIDAGAGKFIL